MKNVLFVASEAVPFVKTGGLADVAGTLPKYTDREKYDVRVILPKYACMKEKDGLEYKTHFYTDVSWRKQYTGIFETVKDGVTFYFVDNEYYFSGNTPYGDTLWDIEKFTFFCRAVLSFLPILGWKPDIIHCNDWQSALIPVFLKSHFKGNLFYKDIKTVLTVHNLKFQGIWGKEILDDILGLDGSYFTSDKLEAYGGVNLLKGGLVYADRINTVSESYGEEIKTPYYGEGLDGLLRARSNALTGIVNGIDYNIFSPENDTILQKKYSEEDFKEGKRANKAYLQKMSELKQDENAFLVGIVSRLTEQKGLDLIECVLDDMLKKENVQLIVLGTGEKRFEDMFTRAQSKYPQRVSANIFYSEELAHRIYAGCDAFLMPSKFEPCGLSQLIALKYGTLPIVRETGGLKDTVVPYNGFEESGTGFSFANYNAHEMLSVTEYAEEIYFNRRDSWNKTCIRAMKEDFSWSASAKKYEALYKELTE